jgi:hypothetical protein
MFRLRARHDRLRLRKKKLRLHPCRHALVRMRANSSESALTLTTKLGAKPELPSERRKGAAGPAAVGRLVKRSAINRANGLGISHQPVTAHQALAGGTVPRQSSGTSHLTTY